MKCLVCDETSARKLFDKNGYAIVKCGRCGFVFVDPTPSKEELVRYYNSIGGISAADLAGYRRSLGRRFKYWLFARLIRFLLRRREKIRLLEIGCSAGDLLMAFRNDPSVAATGLDYSEVNVAFARKHGLDAEAGDLCEKHYPDGSFDAVVALHVVEHLQNPSTTFQEVHRVLKTGGLFIGVTPCVSHIKARLAGPQWKYFGPPAHLWYFAPKTIRLFQEKQGFETLHSSCLYHRAHLRFFARKN